MKRLGFVSNSSSSSFVIINYDDVDAAEFRYRRALEGKVLNIPQTFGGTTEFGWGPEICDKIGDRLNFAALQAYFPYEQRYVDMLYNVLKEKLGVTNVIMNLSPGFEDDDVHGEHVYGYIDHQSAASEGENLDMFSDETSLEGFLFGTGSYIKVDNDNH
jgi:hypothetical protein